VVDNHQNYSNFDFRHAFKRHCYRQKRYCMSFPKMSFRYYRVNALKFSGDSKLYPLKETQFQGHKERTGSQIGRV